MAKDGYDTVAMFLNEFEELSVENARNFVGLTHEAALKIYERNHGLQKGSIFKSAWGQLVRHKFGNEILSRSRSHGCTGAIRYCKLQPKDPALWTYLLLRSSGMNNASLSTSQNSVADEESVTVLNGIQASPQVLGTSVISDYPLGSMNQEAFANIGQIEDSQQTLQVQGIFVTNCEPLTSSNQQVTIQAEDSVYQDFSHYNCDFPTEITVESSSKQKRHVCVDHEHNSEDNEGSRPFWNRMHDEVYFSEEELTPDETSRKKAKPEPSFMDLPNLDSKEMRKYAKQRLKNAPSWIRNWLDSNGFAAGLNLNGYQSHFITADIRKELEENGFAVIKGVFDLALLKEAARYIEIKQRSERIHECSYKDLCRRRFAVGLVTKNGWTKTDYAGYAQQVITASPNLYKCLSELYGTTRLFPNLYEYKYNFSRSSNNGNEFEFVHSDVNYAQLLLAEQVGLSIDGMYQFITPLTPMSPESTTVYVAKGFNRHWKTATYRSMKVGHWTRNGWKSCDPFKQFLPEDVENLIKPMLTPLTADPGDLIIFSATLPHGPNLNSTGAIRIAAYPYLAPYLIGRETFNDRSYLPNGMDSIQNSIRFGTCPKYSAHAAGNYVLPLISRYFFSCLPYRELWRSLLADCLFGFKSWEQFDSSLFAKLLFASPSLEQRTYIDCVHEHMTTDLRSWNDEMAMLLTAHEDHFVNEDMHCTLCNRMAQATLEQWWHSTDAVYHLLMDCDCYRCKDVQQRGWKHWRASGGCTCPVCVNNVEK